ncbi:MAG: hypothetical protein WA130_18645 [Candidatus Methanoperedens sp.]
MKKFISNLISLGFIVLMALAIFEGISVLLGYENPADIEGSGHHAFTDYAYGNWGATLFSVGIFSVFVLNLSFGHAQGHLLRVLISSAGLMSMEAFGERYEEYRRQVPMFLPFLRRRNTGSQVIL